MENPTQKVVKVTLSERWRTMQCWQTRWTLKTPTTWTKLFRSMKRCLPPRQVKTPQPKIRTLQLTFQISPLN